MEKRKHKRVIMNITLKAKKIGAQEPTQIVDDDLYVFDISTGGIGFTSRNHYRIDQFFDTNIVLLNGDKFSCVIKVVRSSMSNDTFTYGCEFVSLNDTDKSRIETYQTLLVDGVY